jgi:hypothetical protein
VLNYELKNKKAFHGHLSFLSSSPPFLFAWGRFFFVLALVSSGRTENGKRGKPNRLRQVLFHGQFLFYVNVINRPLHFNLLKTGHFRKGKKSLKKGRKTK